MIDPLSADLWRVLSALFSIAVLFTLSVGIMVHGDRVPTPWRVVLWAVVLNQAVLAYIQVSRARDTPPGFPVVVDLPLVGVAVSAVLLLIASVGVFVLERPNRRRIPGVPSRGGASAPR